MTPFKVTEYTREAFTTADCWALALEIRRLTGLSILFVSDDPDPTEDRFFAWNHVAIQLPDGRILDVNGVSGSDDFAEIWETEQTLVTSDSPLISLLTRNMDRCYPNANARALARRLLNHYNIPTTGRRHRDALPV
jgi:hypothetical protein